MSIFKRNSDHGAFNTAADALYDTLKQSGGALVDKAATSAMLSMESADIATRAVGEASEQEVRARVKAILVESGVAEQDITENVLDAATITMMAAGNPVEYSRATGNVIPSNVENANTRVVNVVSPASIDTRNERALSQEAFDERALTDHLAFSTVFNSQACRQDEFGEAFYKTIILTPNQPGLRVTVRRTQVLNEVRHDITGRPADFSRRNLLEAAIDSSILANQVTACVPNYIPGLTENVNNFSDKVQPYPVVVNGTRIMTAPLRPAQRIDFLGLSQNPTFTSAGPLDQNSSLDSRLELKSIYIAISDNNGNESVVKFDTSNMPRRLFNSATEGYNTEVTLQFETTNLPLAASTKDVSGAPSSALSFLTGAYANYVIRLYAEVNGRANLEQGNVSVSSGGFQIESVWERHADGQSTPVTDKAILDDISTKLASLTLVGYDLRGNRSNLDRRERGLIVTSTEQSEVYTVPLGSPITASTPLTDTRTGVDVIGPINAARIRNSNNAVTKLLDYAATMEELQISTDRRTEVAHIEGMGRHLIRPFFERHTIDLLQHVNTIKSQDRAQDVKSALTNVIREAAYRMYRDSGYGVALENMTGSTSEKPLLTIGTDPNLERHLMVDGDTRTMSIGFDFKIVSTMDMRMYNKIAVTFTRPTAEGADPLTFGAMAYMPELATSLPISRNNGTTKEITVQPRTLHVNLCPLLVIFDVVNLDKVVKDGMPVAMREIQVTTGP